MIKYVAGRWYVVYQVGAVKFVRSFETKEEAEELLDVIQGIW